MMTLMLQKVSFLENYFFNFSVYNSQYDNWRKLAKMPIALRLFSTVHVDKSIFVFGGYSIKFEKEFDYTFQYDYFIDAWMLGPLKMMSPRHGHRTIKYMGGLLHIGGSGTQIFILPF